MNKINKYNAILSMSFDKKGLKSVSIFDIQKYINNEFIDLTTEELNEICYKNKEITLLEYKSEFHKGFSKTFRNENGFTVSEIFDIIEKFEMQSRPLSNWFDEIDRSHIFFEGFSKIPSKDNTYGIYWGS